MRIGLYHGYELTGSGSNEYSRYLSKNLADSGNEVHIICREPNPEKISFLSEAYSWDKVGNVKSLFKRDSIKEICVLHQLPHAKVRPVFLTDKQREGNVKSFISLSSSELDEYHKLNEKLIKVILSKYRFDVLHANHLIYQPVAALGSCISTSTPLVIYPHGSSIEYAIKVDDRYKILALKALLGCSGLIIGNREVRDRILKIYSEHRDTILKKSKIVGVGVETSLFKPVKKEERGRNISELVKTNGKGGKSPKLSQELINKLENLDISATQAYWNKYDQSLPDKDFNEKLKQIPWNEKIMLFVGALTAGKGLQSVITALPAILSQHPNTHLLIVGAGAYREVLEGLVYAISTANKSLLFELCKRGIDLDRNELTGPWEDVQIYLNKPKNLAKTFNNGKLLKTHVSFLGRLDHSRLKYLFPCADLTIFPSIIPEAYPLVLMESLSNGVLPLVSYFSGFKDGLDELEPFLGKELIDKMKISIDPRNRIENIISNVSYLLSNNDLNLYSAKLRKIAVEKYDWKIRVEQMVETYTYFEKNKSYPIN
jgi:glycosyltransferase involved in cell wall biosynthesis